MISKMEKRILASVLAFLMCVTTGYTGVVTTYAEETQDSNVTEISAEIENETTLEADADASIYRFIPKETGNYHFYSIDSGDTYGAVYDASMNLLQEASDDGEGSIDFSINMEFTAGDVYYLGVKYYLDVDAGTIKWKVEKAESKVSEQNVESMLPEETEQPEMGDQTEETEATTQFEQSENPWQYELDATGTGLIITGYAGEDKNLEVPEELEYEGEKYPVTEIGGYSFQCTDIESIILPANLKTIGEQAFLECNSLMRVDFTKAKNLETIGRYAFGSCRALYQVEIPEKVTSIGYGAFEYDYSLNTVDFTKAKSLEIIEDYAFQSCNALNQIEIPEKVTSIGYGAFEYSYSLNTVDFTKAKSLETIEDYTFAGCNSLENINLEEATNLKKIGNCAFYEIGTNMMIIPESVESIVEDSSWSYTFSKVNEYGFTIYGSLGTVAKTYADNSNERVIFYDINGVYLEKGENNATIEVTGDTYQVDVKWPKNTNDAGIIWTSSDKSVATVDSQGLVSRKAGVKKGSVTITATKGACSDSIELSFLKPSKTSEDGLWRYRVLSDKTVAICGYTGNGEPKVTIPDSIDGHKVTRLQKFIECNWDGIKTIILPKTLTAIEEGVFVNYSGDIIIPDENHIDYLGSGAFGYAYNKYVYGPEDFALKNSINNYRIDKKLYIYCDGWKQSNSDGTYTYTVEVKHIPSELSENEKVTWTSSDANMVSISNVEENGHKVQVTGALSGSYGEVTIKASVNGYKASLKLNFEQKSLVSGDYTYTVIDEEQKTAAIVRYNSGSSNCIEIPQKLDGYTITTIKENAFYSATSNEKHVFVIPNTVTKIERYAFGLSLDNVVVVGTSETEAEHFVKRYGNKATFCERRQMVLNHQNVELLIDTTNQEVVNGTLELSAVYAPKDDNTIEWTSSNTNVATVDTSGTVMAKKPGKAVITATYGKLAETCTINVQYVCNGYKYLELNDGTVEFKGHNDYNTDIPTTINHKKVTVIGENAVQSYSNIVIPNTITTLKKNAISAQGQGNEITITVPNSVTKIAEDAFTDIGGEYEIYASKDSAVKAYLDKYKYDYIKFHEDELIIGGASQVEQIQKGQSVKLYIEHMPADVPEAELPIWTLSNQNSVSIKTDKWGNIEVTGKEVTQAPVNITCKIGNHKVVIPVSVYDCPEYAEGDYIYTVNKDGNVNIKAYKGTDKKVSVPSKIDGKKVVSLAGFGGNEDLEQVTIPKTVTDIQYNAFYNCVNLSTVNFEENSELSSIGNTAFTYSGLTTLKLPNSVTSIGKAAFQGCSRLATVTLSSKMESISNSAFRNCVKISSITIPNKVKYIDGYAFADTGLTQITIPESVESISSCAFQNCEKLKDVTIKNKKAYIEIGAFENCGFEKLTLGQSKIGSGAFLGNKSLTTLTLQEGVTTLAYRAFSQCENLETIKFPTTLKKIDMDAFSGTKWFENQPDGAVYVNDILLAYKGDPEKVTIKSGTKYIESGAFGDKKNLTSVEIPKSVTTIRTAAFVNCEKLTRIVIPPSVTKIESQAIGYIGTYIGEYMTDSYSVYNANKDCNLVIAGVKESAAEKYAKENGFTFEAITPVDIPITKITLSKTSETLTIGAKTQIKAACLPEDTTESTSITWKSSNTKVATVDKAGNVTAVGEGTANIVASAGSCTATCKITVNIKAPNGVTNLKAESAGKNRVKLSWTKSEKATGYLIYGKKASGKYGYVGMTSNITYTDIKAADTEYNFYWVYPYAVNASGKRVINTSCKYVYAKGVTKPVTNLKASGVKGGVTLTWSKSNDAVGYIVYAARNNGKTFSYIGMTGGTTFTDKQASKTGYNYYRVYPYHKDAQGKRVLGSSAAYVYAKAK